VPRKYKFQTVKVCLPHWLRSRLFRKCYSLCKTI